jgi:hypothetical protein
VRARPLQAASFAADLVKGCGELFSALGPRLGGGERGERLVVPITVPVAADGRVVLNTGHVDAPRHPATMTVVRQPPARHGYRFAISLARSGPDPLVIPGVRAAGDPSGPEASLAQLRVDVADRGLAVTGTAAGGSPVAIELSDETACLLATALLITIGVKLRKAERGDV